MKDLDKRITNIQMILWKNVWSMRYRSLKEGKKYNSALVSMRLKQEFSNCSNALFRKMLGTPGRSNC